ncbi:hypothetical protein RS030_111874 [Cryptosporidium xiaoi]|uniref:Homeobox-containing protein n=1 Tax=Cryptosporidium xiaoi TaxID=659607 RepID=A0AAV9Y214_9CRYT
MTFDNKNNAISDSNSNDPSVEIDAIKSENVKNKCYKINNTVLGDDGRINDLANKKMDDNRVNIKETNNKDKFTTGFTKLVKEKKRNNIENDNNKELKLRGKNMKMKEVTNNSNNFDLFKSKTKDNVNKNIMKSKNGHELDFTRDIQSIKSSNIKSLKVNNVYSKSENNIQDDTTSTSFSAADNDRSNKNFKQKRKNSVITDVKNDYHKNVNSSNDKCCELSNVMDYSNNNDTKEYMTKDCWKNKAKTMSLKLGDITKNEFKTNINTEKVQNDKKNNKLSTLYIENSECNTITKIVKDRSKNKKNIINNNNNSADMSNDLLISNIFNWLKERQSLAIKWLNNNGKCHKIAEKQSEYYLYGNTGGFNKNKNYWKIVKNKNRNNIIYNCNVNYQKPYSSNTNNTSYYAARNKYYKRGNNSKLSSNDRNNITLNYSDYPQINGSLYLHNNTKQKQKQKIINNGNKEFEYKNKKRTNGSID